MKNKTIEINGKVQSVPEGTLISELLHDVPELRMPCAGHGRCGKCKVKVERLEKIHCEMVGTALDARCPVSAPDENERKFLAENELKKGIRLACRTKILGDCRISTISGGENEIVLEGGKFSSNNTLNHISNDASNHVSNETFFKTALFQNLGAAVDLGTTTLAISLWNQNGLLAKDGAMNPQISFGADVISRIEKSLGGEAKMLAQAVRSGIRQLLENVCQKAGYQIEAIDTLVVTGNTAMLYLLTEKCPKSLSKAPFCADWLAGEWLSARELELGCPNAKVYLPHCISAFVGADITTALLASKVNRDDKKRLLVDIGTNGEVVLWTGKQYLCCSTAAGSAFEGAGLSMGMDARSGAIFKVSVPKVSVPKISISKISISDDLQNCGFEVQVIGNQEPVGICGSGVIDAVSCLLESEIMDETGYLEEDDAVIAGNVKITQEDIRKIQLAKSAICAGIEAVLHQKDMCADDLDELLVAGGFGSRLDLENAIKIGLLPQIAKEKLIVCGNAALTGAQMLLCQRDLLEEEKAIVKMCEHMNLATDSYFQERYMEGMLFPTQE